MNANLCDVAKDLEKKHFIHQTGKDPSELSGPVTLKNELTLESIKQSSLLPNLARDKNGQIVEGLFDLHQVLDDNVEKSLEKAIQKRRDYFKKGEFFGFRLEAKHGLPEHSGLSVGRLALNTSDEKVYCDLGYKYKRISSEKFEKDVLVSDPSIPITLDLSDSDIDDARRVIWQVCDNANDFKRVECSIKTPGVLSLVIELPVGSAIGTYRILGVE